MVIKEGAKSSWRNDSRERRRGKGRGGLGRTALGRGSNKLGKRLIELRAPKQRVAGVRVERTWAAGVFGSWGRRGVKKWNC